jgi:hypothetical protein
VNYCCQRRNLYLRRIVLFVMIVNEIVLLRVNLHIMVFRVIILFVIFYGCKNLSGSDVKFRPEWLAHPMEFRSEIEKCFIYREIDEFPGTSGPFEVFLMNGYAESVIRNAAEWRPGIANRKVLSIEIIFTKYPLAKEDWITNYYVLLADRLKVLFSVDPSLNASSIKYSLVLQTRSRTANESAGMKHGILISYELFDPEVLAIRQKSMSSPNAHALTSGDARDTIKVASPDSKEWRNETLFYDSETRAGNVRSRQVQPSKPKKRKSTVKQKCPDFKR